MTRTIFIDAKMKQKDYNNWFKQVVEKHYPEYVDLMSKDFDDKGIKYMKIVIPPHNENSSDIEINNYDNELTVYFDNGHSHFDSIDEPKNQMEFQLAFDMFESIKNEDIVVISYYSNDELSIVSMQHRDESLMKGNFDKIDIVSYKGKLNKTEKNTLPNNSNRFTTN